MAMVRSVLVVCVGNVCRSPVGERILDRALNGHPFSFSSSGLGALVGEGADAQAAEVAALHGVSLDGHVARQFTAQMGRQHDLILVMEPGHRNAIGRQAPELSGRCLLFDQWTGAKGIADPYRKSIDFHEAVFSELKAAGEAWSSWLMNQTARKG
ncbi:MAG: protein-tyrosine phosphatase [Rhodobacteraceae bacterium HLUCCA12]|nr:MAG: protein-tyrosine phosphatase [Rhodobacteraceae bacterium HLUCCA12]